VEDRRSMFAGGPSPSPAGSRKVLRIIVEGNIGCGKTTFLSIFSRKSTSLLNKPLVVPEPIDLWRNVGGSNIFQRLADDPKRWSFTFQSYVQMTMLKVNYPPSPNLQFLTTSRLYLTDSRNDAHRGKSQSDGTISLLRPVLF